MKPGGLLTGFVIVGVFGLIAQAGGLGAGLIWDDVELVARDVRIRDLSFVGSAFGESYFGGARDSEMYRPVVNASLALDWLVSGSEPGDVLVGWFHLVNLLLHAVNAGLVYVFLALLTGRRLGASILGAALFAVHPLATETVGWVAGRCDLLAMLFGLGAGIFLLESVRKRWMLLPALVCYGLSLFAKASLASIPLLVLLAINAYRDVPFKRLLGRRLLPRFAVFVIPAAVWIAARIAVLGAAFPQSGGRRWKPQHVDALDGVLGMGRAVCIYLSNLVLPVRLCGDYSADVATTPSLGGIGPEAGVGVALMVLGIVLGALFLRRARWGFPVLAFFVALIPVLQFVPIGAILADRFLYFPMVFAALLAGEGLEYIARHVQEKPARAVTAALFVLLGAMSHLRAPVWTDDVSFNRDVLVSYPAARRAHQRLAVALAERGRPGDRDEAKTLLRDAIAGLRLAGEERKTLGALEIEDGNLDAAEDLLDGAFRDARDDRLRAEVLYNLAVISRRRGRPDEARALLRECLELVPGFPEAEAMLGRLGD